MGGRKVKRAILDILHYCEVPYVQIRSQEGWLDIVPQARKSFSNILDPREISIEFVAKLREVVHDLLGHGFNLPESMWTDLLPWPMTSMEKK